MVHTNIIHRKFQSIWPEYQNIDMMSICIFLVSLFEIKPNGNHLDTIKANWPLVCTKLKYEYQNP